MHYVLAGLDRNLSPLVGEADLLGISWCAHPDLTTGKSTRHNGKRERIKLLER